MDRPTAKTLAQKLCEKLGAESDNTRINFLVEDFGKKENVTCTSIFIGVDLNKTRRRITSILVVSFSGYQTRLYYHENSWKPPGSLPQFPAQGENPP